MRLHVDDDLARKEFSCSYICDKTYLLPTYLPIPHLSGFFDVSNFVVIPACIRSFDVRLSSFLKFFVKTFTVLDAVHTSEGIKYSNQEYTRVGYPILGCFRVQVPENL